MQLKIHLNSFKKHAKLSLQLLIQKIFFFQCCRRPFPSSFFLNMTTLSEVSVHFTSSKAQTSPTSKELSSANFLQPAEKCALLAPIMYLIDQALPSETERVVLVLSVLKCLFKKRNGTVCKGVNKRFVSFVKSLGLDKKFGMHTHFLFHKIQLHFLFQAYHIVSIDIRPSHGDNEERILGFESLSSLKRILGFENFSSLQSSICNEWRTLQQHHQSKTTKIRVKNSHPCNLEWKNDMCGNCKRYEVSKKNSFLLSCLFSGLVESHSQFPQTWANCLPH